MPGNPSGGFSFVHLDTANIVSGHRELQRAILGSMLDLLQAATKSGSIRDLDFTWKQARREGKALGV